MASGLRAPRLARMGIGHLRKILMMDEFTTFGAAILPARNAQPGSIRALRDELWGCLLLAPIGAVALSTPCRRVLTLA